MTGVKIFSFNLSLFVVAQVHNVVKVGIAEYGMKYASITILG